MGKADEALKEYLDQNDVFADAFNYYLYKGNQIIDPNSLKKLDATQHIPKYAQSRRGNQRDKIRDLLKSAVIK